MYPFKELGFPPYRNNAITSILCDFGMQRKISKNLGNAAYLIFKQR